MACLKFKALVWLGAVLAAAYATSGSSADTAEIPGIDSGPQTLYLHTEYLPYRTTADKRIARHLGYEIVHKGVAYRLGREIVRQAVLIAARDEMGLAACDKTLGETRPKDVDVVDLLLVERADLLGKWQLRLIPFDNKGERWEKTYNYTANSTTMYADMIPKLEVDTRGVFLDALKAAGLAGEKPPPHAPKPPSKEIEEQLGQVDFVAQYSAVRAAHHAIAAHGETPEWLGILVRGYANLAVLTRHQWNSATEVFTARSWLYAQRMMVATQQSNLARWHRAYAWALGGTLHHALADLEQLEPAGKEDDDSENTDNITEAAPPWTRLIKPYCMCDRAATKQIGEQDTSLKPWATRLWFQLTSAYRQYRWNYSAGEETVETAPTAYGVYAELTYFGGQLGATRSIAALAPSKFTRHVPQSLRRIRGLPKSVQQIVIGAPLKEVPQDTVSSDADSPSTFSGLPMAIARQLRQTSEQEDGAGLSWSVLAYLLEEEQFVQIANFLDRRTVVTEAPPADQVDAVLPLVKDHRYAAYIDSFRYNSLHDEEALQHLLETIHYEDPRLNMYSMFRRMWFIKDAQGNAIGATGCQNASRNFTMPGMLEYILFNGAVPFPNSPDFCKILTDEFRTIAPHSEIGMRLAIHNVGKPKPDDLRQWESQVKEDPDAFYLLATRYNSLNDSEGAVRCYEKSLQLVPASLTAIDLANLYHEQGNDEKLEQTLLDFLQTKGPGWESASAHYQMATRLIERGKWQKAKPHAQAAGQSLSTWGLVIASLVSEGLGEWGESERLIRTLSQNHPIAHGEAWYFWCRRTGRGDVESAKKVADVSFAAELSRPQQVNFVARGAYHLLCGDAGRSLAAYRHATSFGRTITTSLMVAQLSRERGNARQRKKELAAIEKVAEESRLSIPSDETQGVAAGLAVIRLIKTGDASEDRLAKIDDRLREVAPDTRAELTYFVGKELEAQGESALAEEYWRWSVRLPAMGWVHTTLSGMELAKRHGTSRPDDDVLDEDDLWPPLPAEQEDKTKEEENGNDAGAE